MSSCRLFFVWALVLSAGVLAPSTAQAQRYDAGRTVIVFGGFGYVDESLNERLVELIRGGTSTSAALAGEGRDLEQLVEQGARTTLPGGLPRWSAHKIVFGPRDLASVFTEVTKETTPDTRQMLSAFDRAYLLVLTGGFEHQAVLQTGFGDGVTYHAYVEVGVSASLVDLAGSGDILLSATAMGIDETEALSERDAPDAPVWRDRFASAYVAGARKALNLLARLASDADPRRREAAEDTYMVTGALAGTGPAPEHRRAATVFDWGPPTDETNACAPTNTCPPGSKACGAVTAYLVTAISQALSQSGRRVLPPLMWQEAARQSKQIAVYTLSLPTSGLPEVASSTVMDVSPRRATFKAVATLDGLVHETTVVRNSVVATDGYTALINAIVARTDAKTCEVVPGSDHMLAKQGVGRGYVEDRRPVTAPALDADSLRFQYLRAIGAAAQTIAASRGR